MAGTDKSQGVLGGGPPTSSTHHHNPMHTTLQVISFSPKTCLELLKSGALSKQQIEFEYQYFKANIDSFEVTSKTRTVNEISKIKSLSDCFTKGLCVDVDKYVENLNEYSKLISFFSCRLNDAKSWLEELQTRTTLPSPTPSPSPSVELQEPVSFLNFDIKDYQVEDFRTLIYTTIGERKVCYFGNKPYQYSKVVHKPQEYPTSGVIRDITDKLMDNIPDFDIEKYSCLVTLYEDGSNYIPFHSDSELGIELCSNIYTVSIGSTREIHFCNTIGNVVPKSYLLPHGSVYCMSSESQLLWEHSIPKCGVKSPRVSLTFRHMAADPPPPVPSSPAVPPIQPPTAGFECAPNPNLNPVHRVLLLTDSIHASFNTRLLGDNVYSVRKINFNLVNTKMFEKEFEYSDMIVISCGVNDLSRNQYTASSLASEMRDQVHSWCTKYPDKQFIFNSILNVSRNVNGGHIINQNIDNFNKFVFEMSLNISNLWFLDTQFVILNRRLQGLNPHGNGVHISFSTARALRSVLQGCILNFFRDTHAEVWPLRPQFWQIRNRYY